MPTRAELIKEIEGVLPPWVWEKNKSQIKHMKYGQLQAVISILKDFMEMSMGHIEELQKGLSELRQVVEDGQNR